MQIIDNFLPDDLYKQLCATLLDGGVWRYGSKSNRATDPHGHWSWKPVHDQRLNLADIGDHLVRLPNQIIHLAHHELMKQDQLRGRKLIRCYANGYTYGTDGYVHTDSHRKDELTAILYVCRSWDQDWAGETVVMQVSGPTAVLPKPNRLLVINSNDPHAARSVSRKCTELRAVMVFKLRPARDVGFERLSEFLVRSGALTLKHGDGTLHDHLVRCYSLCKERGLNDIVSTAAGIHSVYGTNAFQQQVFNPDTGGRTKVANACGMPAERLAWYFSIIDRPQALTEAKQAQGGTGYILKLRHDSVILVSKEDYEALCLIEAANLLDQGQIAKQPYLDNLWITHAPPPQHDPRP